MLHAAVGTGPHLIGANNMAIVNINGFDRHFNKNLV
jgi:hypothetical protein